MHYDNISKDDIFYRARGKELSLQHVSNVIFGKSPCLSPSQKIGHYNKFTYLLLSK